MKSNPSPALARSSASVVQTAPPLSRLAPFVLTPEFDPTGWWMSELVSGLRVFWDGRKFIRPDGEVIVAPLWFTDGFPSKSLDGDLRIDQKSREDVLLTLSSGESGWSKIRFVAFDYPGSSASFERRQDAVENAWRSSLSSYISLHHFERIQSIDHFRSECTRLSHIRGTALILVQPEAPYDRGLSSSMFLLPISYVEFPTVQTEGSASVETVDSVDSVESVEFNSTETETETETSGFFPYSTVGWGGGTPLLPESEVDK